MARKREPARRCTGGNYEGRKVQKAYPPLSMRKPKQDISANDSGQTNQENKEGCEIKVSDIVGVAEREGTTSPVASCSAQIVEPVAGSSSGMMHDSEGDSSSNDDDDDDLDDIAKTAVAQMSDDSDSSSGDDADEEDMAEEKAFFIDKKPGKLQETVRPSLNKKDANRGKHSRRTDIKLASEIECNVDSSNVYVNVDPYNKPNKPNKKLEKMLLRHEKHKDIMAKSVVQSDFEKRHATPVYSESRNQLKKQRRAEKEKTKGSKWYNMPATEMTDELKNDLSILQMRKVLDPKRFYKGNDVRSLPKYFQMGTVVEPAADFYHARIPKKQRKGTIVDELLADAEFRKRNKRKYAEVQEATKGSKGAFKHAKRLKKRKR